MAEAPENKKQQFTPYIRKIPLARKIKIYSVAASIFIGIHAVWLYIQEKYVPREKREDLILLDAAKKLFKKDT